MDVLSAIQLAWLDYVVGFRGDNLANIVAVQTAESNRQVSVVNNTAFPDKPNYHAPGPSDSPEYSVGISQINAVVPGRAEAWGMTVDQYAKALTDPLFNVKEAYKISSNGSDLSPWSTYNQGTYRQNLGEASNVALFVLTMNNGGQLPTQDNPPDVWGIPAGDWQKVGGVWIPIPFKGLGGNVKEGVTNIPNPLKGVDALAAFFTNTQMWWRVLFVLGGLGLVAFGASIALRGTIPAPKVMPVPV